MNDQQITADERKRRNADLRKRRLKAQRLLRSIGFSCDETTAWLLSGKSGVLIDLGCDALAPINTKEEAIAWLMNRERQAGMEEARRQMREAIGVLR